MQGTVELSGFVDHVGDREKADHIAWNVKGVKDVKDHIVVRPRRPTADSGPGRSSWPPDAEPFRFEVSNRPKVISPFCNALVAFRWGLTGGTTSTLGDTPVNTVPTDGASIAPRERNRWPRCSWRHHVGYQRCVISGEILTGGPHRSAQGKLISPWEHFV